MPVCQFEQPQSEYVRGVGLAHQIAAPHQHVEHAKQLIGRTLQPAGDFLQVQAVGLGREQFQHVQTLFQGGGRVARLLDCGDFCIDNQAPRFYI